MFGILGPVFSARLPFGLAGDGAVWNDAAIWLNPVG